MENIKSLLTEIEQTQVPPSWRTTARLPTGKTLVRLAEETKRLTGLFLTAGPSEFLTRGASDLGKCRQEVGMAMLLVEKERSYLTKLANLIDEINVKLAQSDE